MLVDSFFFSFLINRGNASCFYERLLGSLSVEHFKVYFLWNVHFLRFAFFYFSTRYYIYMTAMNRQRVMRDKKKRQKKREF